MYKKNVFKVTCLVLTLTLILSMIFTACSKEGSNQQGTSQEQSTQSASQASEQAIENPTEQFVNLVWQLPVPLEPRPSEKLVVDEINKYLKENLNCSLEFVFTDWGSYGEKIKVISAAGEEFDLFGPFGTTFSQIVTRGSALAIDDLLSKYGQNVLNKVPSSVWSAVTVKGKKYAVINGSPWVWCNGLVFKKDLVEKYAFDYANAHTLKDLEPFCKILKEKEPGVIPICGGKDWNPYLAGQDDGFRDKVDPVVPGFVVYHTDLNDLAYIWDDREYCDVFKTLNDFYKKGYIAKDVGTKQDHAAEFKTGKYAIYWGTAYDKTGDKSSNTAGFPCVESTLDRVGLLVTGNINSNVTFISSTSKQSERAMLLINQIFGDKTFFNTICYGLEGENYNVISGKGTDNPTIEVTTPAKWAIWHTWVGELLDQWPSNWNNQSMLDTFKEFRSQAKASPILGFTFDTEPVKKELAQLESLKSEWKVLYTGMIGNVDECISKYIEKCKNAGVEKVMDEARKQLADWKSANGK